MGGFHLFEPTSSDTQYTSQEDDKPLHPLLADDLTLHDMYSLTMPTEAEIMDKGKSDWLAKSLVLLQTSWFVTQCLARGMKHLPVTHLEIVTLAYAAMNFVIFIFWWKKPRNVHRPIRVFRRSAGDTQSQVGDPVPDIERISEATWKAIGKRLIAMIYFIVGLQDQDVDLRREDKVPMFWANSTGGKDLIISDSIVLVVGVCFGAIHCVAWHFSFPTHTELLMWRITSIALTTLPICIPLIFGLAGLLGGLLELDDSADIVFCTAPVIGILYIFARVITLVLAFVSLRDLPPGAYETVHWTTFIPHV